jgi:hypothetical protein
MFDYVTKSAADERKRVHVALIGFAVVLVLGSAFSLASGVTVIGVVDLIWGILLGAAELSRSLRSRETHR